MAVRTVSQSGPLSDSATFGGSAFSNGDSILNPPANGFTLNIDQNATVAGFGAAGSGSGNGRTIVNSGVTLTLTGNVIQGNAKFTLGSGAGNAHLVFDCTAADRKYLHGDADNSTTYANCTFEILGISGSPCSVTKVGSNSCWFDCFSEASFNGYEKTGYECFYGDFTGIGKADGSFSLARNTFGARPMKLDHCNFDGCAVVSKKRPYSGSASGGYYIRNCKFTNATGTHHLETIVDASASAPDDDITNCSFDDSAKAINVDAKIHIDGNVFGEPPDLAGGPLLSFNDNLIHDSGVSLPTPSPIVSGNYWLAKLTHPGNPHCFNNPLNGSVYEHNIFEYSKAAAIDGGECVYAPGSDMSVTVRYNLAVPSETDGFGIGNIAHFARSGGTTGRWVVEHNTIVGTASTYAAYTETGTDNVPLYSSVKSNLVVDLTGNSAAVCYDVFEAYTDMAVPTDCTHNGMFGQIDYADFVSGLTLAGYRSHFTARPGDGTDVVGNPNFLDPTRNFANWAVYKGVANGGDSLATRTAAALALVMADASLVASDLVPWVKQGFIVQNAAMRTAAHDGTVMGAIQEAAPTPGGRGGFRTGGNLNNTGILTGGVL